MPATADYNYQTDEGNLFKVRMDSDSVLDAIRGASPTGELTENMHVKVQRNNREVGISPRHVLFGRSVGTESGATTCLIDTGTRYKRVPILTITAFDGIVTGPIGGAGVTNFQQNGATYYALRQVAEEVR